MLALLHLSVVSAQQDPNYTLYKYNMNLINSAYAGNTVGIELGLNFKSQWSGLQGAPETQNVYLSMSAGNNVGLGLTVINDQTFIEKQTSVMAQFSYRLQLTQHDELYLGVNAGGSTYDANTEGLRTFDIQPDASLMNLDGDFTPNVGAGLYLKGKHYFVSYSIPKILTPDRLESKDGLAKVGRDKMHMYLAGGYIFLLSRDIDFNPSVLVRHVEGSPLSVDATAAFEFKEKMELGANYRFDEAIGGYLLLSAIDWLQIGYAYQSALDNKIDNIDNGTHEVFLKFKL